MRPVQRSACTTRLAALLLFSGLCSAQSLVYGITFHKRIMASNNAITSGPMHERLSGIFTLWSIRRSCSKDLRCRTPSSIWLTQPRTLSLVPVVGCA